MLSISALMFIISFLLILGFICSCLVSQGRSRRSLIWGFCYFLIQSSNAINIPLSIASWTPKKFSMLYIHIHLFKNTFHFPFIFVLWSMVYSFPMVTSTNRHGLALDNNKSIFFTVLVARSPKLRCWQGNIFSEGPRGDFQLLLALCVIWILTMLFQLHGLLRICVFSSF